MNKRHRAIVLAAVMALLNCSSTPGRSLPLHAPESEPVNSNGGPSITLAAEPEVLTLPRALALTLERSPDLKSFAYTARITEARVIQAGLLPNPELSYQLEDAFGPYGNDSYSQATLQLSQVIELGGKRSARIGAATALRDQYSDDYEMKRVEILSSLTEKFIRTVADEYQLELARKGEELARQSLEAIRKQASAGRLSEIEEAKARVAVAKSHINAEHAEHQLLSSRRELSLFWGSETPRFTRIDTNLFQAVSLPTFQELEARVDNSPEIRRWATEKRVREAEEKLAAAKSIPNLTLSGGPRRLEAANQDSWVFQVSMPLPIFDRNQGNRAEAGALAERVTLDEERARLRLKSALYGLYQETKHALVVVEAMKKEILPQAERSLTIARRAHSEGQLSYRELLDSQATLLAASSENIEAAYTLHACINSIERLLGVSLTDKQATMQSGIPG